MRSIIRKFQTQRDFCPRNFCPRITQTNALSSQPHCLSQTISIWQIIALYINVKKGNILQSSAACALSQVSNIKWNAATSICDHEVALKLN